MTLKNWQKLLKIGKGRGTEGGAGKRTPGSKVLALETTGTNAKMMMLKTVFYSQYIFGEEWLSP